MPSKDQFPSPLRVIEPIESVQLAPDLDGHHGTNRASGNRPQVYAFIVVAAHHSIGCSRHWADVVRVPAFTAYLAEWPKVACADLAKAQRTIFPFREPPP